MNTLQTRTLGLAVMLLLLMGGCSQTEQVQQAERVISVKAQVMDITDLELVRTYTGSLEGEKQAVIYAKLAETVDSVPVAEGERVSSGQVLISLDKYGPSSRYNEVLSLYRNSEKNEKKMAYLYREGAISESAYDAARTEYEVNKASFEAVSRMVDIVSPIDGVVTSVNVSVGDQVGVGQKLATVASTERLRVRFGVNADHIADFQIGSEVSISSEVSEKRAHGKVVSVASSADPLTRSYEVECLVDNGGGLFTPGMFVRIHFIRDRLVNVLVAPRKAILNLDDQWTAFVVVDGKIERRAVTLGPDVDGHIVVSSGLAVGDTLVTLGQDYVDDGFAVNIVELDEGAR